MNFNAGSKGSDAVPIRIGTPTTLFSVQGMESVERALAELAVGDVVERCALMVQEHMASGGKRVRARLALTAAELLGVDKESAVAWAVCVEMLHNATLVHDDLQDGDMLRRGVPTTWVRHGMPQAINTGDLMLMLPFVGIDEIETDDAIRWRLSRAVARRASEAVRGQSLEMDLLDGLHRDWPTFLRAVHGKTGQLLALPVEGAALLAGFSAEEAEKLGDEFIALGEIFQLQDDTRDLYAEKGRGQRGCDLREGKVSALVVAHLELNPQDGDWLLGVLRTPRDRTSEGDIELAIRAFQDGGALASVLARIERLNLELMDSPQLLRLPAIRTVALDLADWLLARATSNIDITP